MYGNGDRFMRRKKIMNLHIAARQLSPNTDSLWLWGNRGENQFVFIFEQKQDFMVCYIQKSIYQDALLLRYSLSYGNRFSGLSLIFIRDHLSHRVGKAESQLTYLVSNTILMSIFKVFFFTHSILGIIWVGSEKECLNSNCFDIIW